ncbi:recombinase RecA [Neisseria zalophi]|uniref:Recombinase RecA n=1 Tax=Neisseria zalophi TaxID=640030 RepID=A0A5J6PW71_9NEIS|nr:recombinase RecA [Neisseria zalophi]QEY26815.1 recombinase RecA [Neisseria zalophi]
MPFSETEIQSLLAQKGIGKTILQRLQQMGLDSVSTLACANIDDVLTQGSALTGSTCWKNSPQAKAAISNAIAWAQQQSVSPKPTYKTENKQT